jgi:hypothetical protein
MTAWDDQEPTPAEKMRALRPVAWALIAFWAVMMAVVVLA